MRVLRGPRTLTAANADLRARVARAAERAVDPAYAAVFLARVGNPPPGPLDDDVPEGPQDLADAEAGLDALERWRALDGVPEFNYRNPLRRKKVTP